MSSPRPVEAGEIARIARAGQVLDYALMTVAAGALCFATVNVAILAIDHGIPVWIAWMLEPLVGIALWASLSSDAVLSRYGHRPGARAWMLRTVTGMATLILNIWSAAFTTTSRSGLKFEPDPAGILLHAIAPVLLILLAETAPRYRAAFAAITAELAAAARSGPDAAPTATGAAATRGTDPPRSEAHTAHDSAPPQHVTPAPPAQASTGRAPAPPPDPDDQGPDPQRPDTPGTPEPGKRQSRSAQPDTGPVTPRAAGPDPRRLSKKQRRRQRRERTDARARAILSYDPHITGAQLADRLDLQPRSGQRILARIKPGTPSAASARSAEGEAQTP